MKESKSKKCFSRFTHRFQKDDMVAYMNALRLRPVFIQQNLATQVDNYINCMDGEKHSEGLQYVIEQLENSKIIVSSPAYDDLVLNRYQGVSKNTSIKIAYLILTDECNFNCSYCFMRREHQEGGTHFGAMSKETAIAAINTFARLSSLDQQDDERTIILYGGEPLLNFDVIKVVVQQVKQLKKINRLAKQTTINIVTNGSLLTDEVVQFLKASEIGIGISIDGADIVTNASRRYCDGSPTFPDIMRGIETCKRNGVTNYSLSVTITKASLENFDSTISFLRQYAISKNIGFNILMSEEDELKDEMEEYAHKASRFLLKAFNIFREDGIYEDRIMRKVNAFVDGKVHIFDCAATGANQIVVAPDGTIVKRFNRSMSWFLRN